MFAFLKGSPEMDQSSLKKVTKNGPNEVEKSVTWNGLNVIKKVTPEMNQNDIKKKNHQK